MWRFMCLTFVGGLGMVSTSALAGPDWDEFCDAGSGPGDAQIVPVGVKTIRGYLATCPNSFGPGDFEDMYRITITAPGIFCARTVLVGNVQDCCNGEPGCCNAVLPAAILGTNFNTQLFLFAGPGVNNGRGLLANDDESGVSQLSKMGRVSTDGTGIVIAVPGDYYLAISGGPGRDPVDAAGQALFNQVLLTEVSGPDGPGGLANNPIDHWAGVGITNVHYEIVLCGSVAGGGGIPTVSQWGMIALAALVMATGAILIVRRQRRIALA